MRNKLFSLNLYCEKVETENGKTWTTKTDSKNPHTHLLDFVINILL